MLIKRQEGYEYKGWKLGQEVRYKNDNFIYKIIGFAEEEPNKNNFIAIDRDDWMKNIKDSIIATSYIDTFSNYLEWVSEDEIEKIEIDVNKEQNQLTDVLILEYKEVFGKVACRIVYQDEEVLKRGEFEDEDIEVFSCWKPQFIQRELHIKCIKEYDDNIFLVNKEEAEIIKEKVRKINEKYGIKERFKPTICGAPYWYIDFEEQGVAGTSWCEDMVDLSRYEFNNCFKTMEQAEIALDRIRKTLEQYQKELLEENK